MTKVAIDVELGAYLIHLADDNVVLGQRLAEYLTRAPELEEELAIGNLALDHLGVARHLYTYAGEVQGHGRSEDELAFLRSEREYTNLLLLEQPNTDFAFVIGRQFLFDAYQVPLWEALSAGRNERLAGIAARAAKEARYHLRHSSSWVVRLGDGTVESHTRMQRAVDELWRFTGEMFEVDEIEEDLVMDGVAADPAVMRSTWVSTVDRVLTEATLTTPDDQFQRSGGRRGIHTEHLGYLLAEMQWMQRAYPGLEW